MFSTAPKQRPVLSIAALSLSVIAGAAFANDTRNNDTQNNNTVYGSWLTGTATVEIKDCGDATPCGFITKVNDQQPDEPPFLDANNPDENLRERPIVGTRILHGFKSKKTSWHKGRIYNPEDGKSYASKLKLKSENALSVKGCVGPICQTQHWVRDVAQE